MIPLSEVEALRLALRERNEQLAFMVGIARTREARTRVLSKTARELGRGYLLALLRLRASGEVFDREAQRDQFVREL